MKLLTESISDTVSEPRFFTLLFALFAIIGLLLTVTGILQREAARQFKEKFAALKLTLLRDLDEIITKRPSPPVNFASWVAARYADYKARLATTP